MKNQQLNQIQQSFVSELEFAILAVCKKYKAEIALDGECKSYYNQEILSIYIPDNSFNLYNFRVDGTQS